jgi:hypothetical protein
MYTFQPRIVTVALVLLSGNISFGQNWTQTSGPTGGFISLAASADGTTLVGATPDSWIYTSTNSAATWALAPVLNLGWNSVGCSADGTKMAIVGNGIYVSADMGATWNQAPVPNFNWNSVTCSTDGSKWFVTADYGYIFSSIDSGTTWTPLTAPSSYHWVGIACSGDGTQVIAAPESGPVYISSDSGSTWSLTGAPIGGPVASSAEGKILIAAEAGAGVLVSTNSGTSWVKTTAPSTNAWQSLASSARGRRVAAACTAGIYFSADAGNTWSEDTPAPGSGWRCLVSSADGDRVVASGNSGTFIRQSPPTPILVITPTTGGPLLSWPVTSVKLVLQQTPDPGTSSWTNVAVVPSLNLTNLHHQIIAPSLTSSCFFRLVQQ